jgi:hypothetical protein
VKNSRQIPAALALVLALGGCSTINSLTGESNDTVLPGQREDAIPGRSQFPESSSAASTAAEPGPAQPPLEAEPPAAADSACEPGDPACQPATGDDTFSDPQ